MSAEREGEQASVAAARQAIYKQLKTWLGLDTKGLAVQVEA